MQICHRNVQVNRQQQVTGSFKMIASVPGFQLAQVGWYHFCQQLLALLFLRGSFPTCFWKHARSFLIDKKMTDTLHQFR